MEGISTPPDYRVEAVAPPTVEIQRRLDAFRSALVADGIDAAVILEASDLVYLTGVMADAHLIVPADDEPRLLVRRDLDRVRLESPIARIEPFGSLRDLGPQLATIGARRIGFELDVLPAARYLRYRSLLEPADIVDASAPLARIRARKSDWEIDCCRAAAAQVHTAFDAVPALLESCRTDRELQIELERVLRHAGHQGPIRFRGLNGQMFYGAVLAGPDGAIAPWADTPLGGPGPNSAVGKGPAGWVIGEGDAITVDLVGAAEGYLADATRTFFRGVGRDPLPEALEVCEGILRAIEEQLKPGVPAGEAYRLGADLASDAGFGDHWMGFGPARVRFVGHGVGLEVNERPFLAAGVEEALEEGNVVAIEPKLVFPGIGAVGVENTYVVTAAGVERVT